MQIQDLQYFEQVQHPPHQNHLPKFNKKILKKQDNKNKKREIDCGTNKKMIKPLFFSLKEIMVYLEQRQFWMHCHVKFLMCLLINVSNGNNELLSYLVTKKYPGCQSTKWIQNLHTCPQSTYFSSAITILKRKQRNLQM